MKTLTLNRKNRAQRSHEGSFTTCAHRITFSYWDFDAELTEELEARLSQEAEDRAHELISSNGCISGELNYLHVDGEEEEIRGWWKIAA